MLTWIRTAFHANRSRLREERESIVKKELRAIIAEMPVEDAATAFRGLASVSELSAELVQATINANIRADKIVEYTFRDGSKLTIKSGKDITQGGPGW